MSLAFSICRQGERADLDPSQHHEPHKEDELAQQQHPHLCRCHLVPVHCIALQCRHEHGSAPRHRPTRHALTTTGDSERQQLSNNIFADCSAVSLQRGYTQLLSVTTTCELGHVACPLLSLQVRMFILKAPSIENHLPKSARKSSGSLRLHCMT